MALNPDTIRPGVPARLPPVESVAPVAPVPDPARKAPDFPQGQRFLAKVEAQLPNGSFKVLLNGQALQMNLPESARPGDKMELVLIASEPRLKFVLLGDARSSTGEGASLSATGRFLGALAQDAARLPAAAPTTSAAPVLSAPPAESRRLPALLREALSQSGLFYESHQAQWLAGKRTLEQLLQEPQGGLPAAAGAIRNSEAPVVHEQTLALVQQQLSVLETGQLSWRGEIWPGQWLEWDIGEHAPAESETAEPGRWQTRLRLTLPKLGEVAATLGLDSRGVHVALGAAAAETAELLQGSRQLLAASMEAAGLSLLAVEVRHDAGK